MAVDSLVKKTSKLMNVILLTFSSHLFFLHAKYLFATTVGFCRSSVLSPKNKVINKQNAKHVYTKQQIHSPNFILAQASAHLNSIQKPVKKITFFIIVFNREA
jgi:hypothetical protein